MTKRIITFLAAAGIAFAALHFTLGPRGYADPHWGHHHHYHHETARPHTDGGK